MRGRLAEERWSSTSLWLVSSRSAWQIATQWRSAQRPRASTTTRSRVSRRRAVGRLIIVRDAHQHLPHLLLHLFHLFPPCGCCCLCRGQLISRDVTAGRFCRSVRVAHSGATRPLDQPTDGDGRRRSADAPGERDDSDATENMTTTQTQMVRPAQPHTHTHSHPPPLTASE